MQTLEEIKAELGEGRFNAIHQVITNAVEAEYTQRLKDFAVEQEEIIAQRIKSLEEENRATITKAVEDWKREQTPPSQEDISKVLSQEYLTFNIKIPFEDGQDKEFVISEMPAAAEKKVYKLIKEKLVPNLKDLALMELPDGTIEEKAMALFEVIDPAVELLAEIAAMVLNPKGRSNIDKDWVQNNLSTVRIWNILVAQIEVNRLRDFFSGVSRTSRAGKMNLAATLN